MSPATRQSTGSYPTRRRVLAPESGPLVAGSTPRRAVIRATGTDRPVAERTAAAADDVAREAAGDVAAGTTAPASEPTEGPATMPASPATAPWRMGRTGIATQARPTRLVVLVPAYQPDERLGGLVEDLLGALPGSQVLVVDDGSGTGYTQVFADAANAGAHVIGYPVNAGKGEALRTGLAAARERWPEADVVCADADGQHTPHDVAAVAARVRETGRMTLGVREFTGRVPARSRIGNDLTALLFRGATGWRLRDTQTGLRGYPAGGYGWMLRVPGDRYEYELSALLRASELGMEVEQVGIETVYEPGNGSSHFRPIVDSARIYAPLLRFMGASLASFVIDWVGVMLIHALTGNLLVSVVGARLVSGTANFLINRQVFRAAPGTMGRTAVRYVALAVGIMAASYVLLALLTGIGIPLGIAKIIGDAVLYVVSYSVQRRVVFRERH